MNTDTDAVANTANTDTANVVANTNVTCPSGQTACGSH